MVYKNRMTAPNCRYGAVEWSDVTLLGDSDVVGVLIPRQSRAEPMRHFVNSAAGTHILVDRETSVYTGIAGIDKLMKHERLSRQRANTTIT